MLDDLIAVIQTIQGRIQQHGPSLRGHETRTRTALIDPLLTALGWDVADPSLVTPEYRAEVGWADYALRGSGSNPTAVVEAKRLGSFVENHLDQAVGYCIAQGIPYAAVTDGNHWQLYRTFEPVALVDKRVLDVHIDGTQPHECVLQFLLLWRPNLATGKAISANKPLFSAEPATLVSKPTHIQDPGTVEPPSPSNEGWTSILNLPSDVSWKNLPSTIRFPNGEERPIKPKIWKQVLVEAAEWLISNGGLTKDRCPIGQDSNRYIVHTEPMQLSGKAFFFPAQLSNGLFIASASNAKKAADDCAYLMKYCGQDPSRVQLALN